MARVSPLLMLSAAAMVGLGGCQYLAFLHPRPKLKPAAAQVQPADLHAPAPGALVDHLYADAIKAIEHRDYASALDLLQLARARRSDDPRVLTAMGVIYDKLGRFDLSARYYDLAEAADPGSRVVAIDRLYSQRLQRAAEETSGDAPAVARIEATRHVTQLARIDAVEPPPRIPPGDPLIAPNLALVERAHAAGVRVHDATGQADGARRVETWLARGGWSLGRAPADRLPPADASRVIYPTVYTRVAKALARSLPFPAALESCEDCRRLQVVVGRDAIAAPSRARNAGARSG
jgi:tetratricopeptide (TPR) repeat protein